MGIDSQGNTSLVWVDNQEAWAESSDARLRTTTIASTAAGPQITKQYYTNGRRIASRVNDEVYYLHSDHLGSTTLVTDQSGVEVGRAQYDPYGNIITNTIPVTLTDRLFTGQRWEPSTGLYDYNARFYDPFTGSFIQPDSLIPDPLDPAAWNRFSYVYGNPVNLVDPSGHIPVWDILDIASFGWSLYDFINEPTWGNLGWLALDAVGLLPILPSAGMMRHAGQLDEVGDAARVARGVDEFGAGDEIIYYHTTSTRGAENIRLKGVDPFYGRAEVDFGQGFYVTPNRAQAEDWLARKFKGEGTILEFRVSRSELESFKGLVFDEPNEAWQAFVTVHRTPGTPIHGYDFVEGPLAIPRGDVWIPHKDPTYWQLSIHTEAAAQIFTKGLLP